MDDWLEDVRHVLARAPTSTLPFSEVLERLSMEKTGPPPDPRWLLSALSERTDLFRVISVARGPWAHWREAVRPGGDPLRSLRREDDPWVLLLPPPRSGFGASHPLVERVREGLLAWGQRLDDSSPSGVARWVRASREGSRVCEALISPRNPAP